MVDDNRRDSEWPENKRYARGESPSLFEFRNDLLLQIVYRHQMMRQHQLDVTPHLANKHGNGIGYLRNTAYMVTMIVRDEQCTLREVTLCQPLDIQGFCVFGTRQMFAIVDKQPPALVLIFCDTAPNLVCATMDGNSFSIVILTIITG